MPILPGSPPPTFPGPAGDAATLAAAGAELAQIASALDGVGASRFSVADELGFLAENQASFSWVGQASATFGRFIVDRQNGLHTSGAALGQGAQAILELAQAIAAGQLVAARAESAARDRAARATADPAIVSPFALYADLNAIAAKADGLVEQVKEQTASTLRRLLEAAPHYVAPAPKPKPAPARNHWWAKAGHGIATAARYTLPGTGIIAGDLIDAGTYKAEGNDEAAAASYGRASTFAHATLDVAGQVPAIGELADGANGIYYGLEGDKQDAAISFAGMIPFGGNAATGARLVTKADDVVDVVKGIDHASDAARHADDVPVVRGGGDRVDGSRPHTDRVQPAENPGDAGSRFDESKPPFGTTADEIDEITDLPLGGNHPTGFDRPAGEPDPGAAMRDAIRRVAEMNRRRGLGEPPSAEPTP